MTSNPKHSNPIRLFKLLGARLIARSQAKLLMKHFERFTDVLLDFQGVEAIGQGFVDDVFRVYQNKHPDIRFSYCNANENVEFMILRGLKKKS